MLYRSNQSYPTTKGRASKTCREGLGARESLNRRRPLEFQLRKNPWRCVLGSERRNFLNTSKVPKYSHETKRVRWGTGKERVGKNQGRRLISSTACFDYDGGGEVGSGLWTGRTERVQRNGKDCWEHSGGWGKTQKKTMEVPSRSVELS